MLEGVDTKTRVKKKKEKYVKLCFINVNTIFFLHVRIQFSCFSAFLLKSPFLQRVIFECMSPRPLNKKKISVWINQEVQLGIRNTKEGIFLAKKIISIV